MAERYAVTGYVPDEVARGLNRGGSGSVDVRPERGVQEVAARVQLAEVEDVRVGSSSNGETLVQLILRDEATVETVLRSQASSKGLQRFHDPNLDRLRLAATAKVIEA